MNRNGELLLALTAVLVAVVAALFFAVLRFFAASRGAQRRLKDAGTDTMLLSSALQDAVTKLKAQEQLMRTRAHESEAFSAQIVDSLTAGLLVVDTDGRVRTINPAGRAMLGLDGDLDAGLDATVVGQPYAEALATSGPLVRCLEQGLAASTALAAQDIVVARADGAVHLSVSVSPLTSGGTPRGVVCLFSDVTPMRELEEQLRLKDALARLGELTAGIAHEFRNGLATIHGYSRLLKPEALPDSHRPYVDGIRQEAESLGHVMTNFLKYARPEQMTFVDVDLEAVARRAAGDVAQDVPAGTDVRIDGVFAPIVGDDVLLRQVFSNLIRNGAEACATARVSSPVIHLHGAVDGRFCRVSVDDNGPGIPEEARPRVFDPFFTTRARGTGLGLAIVQKVVVTHNGRVSAGRSPLGGASIQMVFPLADIGSSSTP
jgi:PAS domain S-box-containing protein